MALGYSTDFKGQARYVGNAITSNTLTVVAGDVITVAAVAEQGDQITAWSVSNTGTAISWGSPLASVGDSTNCRVTLWKGVAGATPPTTITVTATSGAELASSKALFVAVHTGAHATDPVPSGNIYSGIGGTDVTQAILPSAAGSCLWMIAGDWSATNSYVAAANCTLAATAYYSEGQMAVVPIRPTTQPRTDASSFTIGESDTSGKITWIAWEVQAAAAAAQHASPIADVTVDNWQDEAAGTTDIYTHIDEATASDSDYIRTQISPSSDVYACSLGTLSDPQSSDGHILHLRYGKDAVSGDVLSLTAELRQGYASEGSQGSLIAMALSNSDIGSGWTQVDYTLSGAEADSISDYTDLQVRLVGNRISGAPANPSVRAVGTRASGTTSVAFTSGGIPTNAEGDLIFIAIETSDSTTLAGTPADITDWTKVLADTTSGAGATGVSTLTVYGRFVPAGGIGGTVTVSGIGNHGCGFMFSVKDHGCSVLGDIVVGGVTDHGTSTSSVTIADITVTANSLIIGVHGLSDDASDTNNFSAGPTNANLASINKFADETVSTGAGGGIALWSATCAGTSTGTTAWTHDTAENAQTLHVGIKPITGVTRRAQVSWLNLETPEAPEGGGIAPLAWLYH